MCLAIPAKVIKIEKDENRARVSIEGIEREVNVTLLPHLRPGEYVLLHAGFAIEIINPKKARETLNLWRQLI